MQIPNVRLIIPGLTSKTVYCPEVSVALYKELWKGFVEDPYHDEPYTEPVPKGRRYDAFRYSYYDTLFDFQTELQIKFSANYRVDERPIWENTYPGSQFEIQFNAWAKSYGFDMDEEVQEIELDMEESKASMSIRSVRGVNKSHAEDLAFEGIRIVRDMAKADAEKLSDAMSITYRSALKWINEARRMMGLPTIKNEAIEEVSNEEAAEVSLT